MATAQEAVDYLATFKDAEAIRVECQQLGIRGIPGNCRKCIVARLLQHKVGGFRVHNGEFRLLNEVYERSHQLPPHVVNAVLQFDTLAWPELVDEKYIH